MSWLDMYSALISLYVDVVSLLVAIPGSTDSDFSLESPVCVGLGLEGGPEFRRFTTGGSGVCLKGGVPVPCEVGWWLWC